MPERLRRPSPSTVIACLALFFAVAGGSAIALQGRNTVDSGDIKPKNVKTSDIANNAVTTRKIKNGGVRKADLAPPEAFHRIGATGQPAFGNGGQGDCIWLKLTAPPLDPFNSPGFYKDPFGEVHLTGVFTNLNGFGGDAACDGDDLADSIIFTLPTGYRPNRLIVVLNYQYDGAISGAEQFIINGDAPVVSGPVTIPAGAVIPSTLGSSDGQQTIIDGITFRAAGPGNPARRGPVELTGEAAELLDRILNR